MGREMEHLQRPRTVGAMAEYDGSWQCGSAAGKLKLIYYLKRKY